MATTQFCLTNAGANLIGPTVSLLSDEDNFTTPFQTGISLSSLQPPNCPATLTVPDNATQIRVFDPNTNSCATINLEGNDLCTLFNLQIDTYQSQSTGQIIFGTFTTSFGPVTDYLIYWYRNGSLTPQFITGKGTLFVPYGNTHPLTGSAALLAPSGTYSIKIAKIQINGLNFSTLDTPPAGFIKATTSCIPTTLVTVTALNCSNGNFTPTAVMYDYTHKFEYSNASVGTSPQDLSTTFDLSLTINYIAFSFTGYDIYDILKITFYGDNYVDPIVIENISVGLNAGTTPGIGNAINSPLKYITSNSDFRKVLNLSTLNRSSNDYLEIRIIPNPTFNQTQWVLYLKCFTTFDCTDCTDQFINQHPKLYSSDTSSTVDSCNRVSVNTKMQACESTQIYSNLKKYLNFGNDSMASQTSPPPKRNYAGNSLYANGISCSFSQRSGAPSQCSPSAQGTTSYNLSLSNGTFTLTVQFSNSANFNTFTSSLISGLTTQRNNYPNYLNPLDPDYFRYISMPYPTSNGCGDNVGANYINIPLWSNYTIDNTTGTLVITFNQISSSASSDYITANGITNCATNCTGSLNNSISAINNQTSVNSLNSSGGFYSNAFNSQNGGFSQTDPQILGSFQSILGAINGYSNVTTMFTQSGTLINTTPIKACDFESLGGWYLTSNLTYSVNQGLSSYYRDFYLLNFLPRVPFNPTYPTDFIINSKAMVNGRLTGSEVIIYQKLDGIVTTDNNFVI